MAMSAGKYRRREGALGAAAGAMVAAFLTKARTVDAAGNVVQKGAWLSQGRLEALTGYSWATIPQALSWARTSGRIEATAMALVNNGCGAWLLTNDPAYIGKYLLKSAVPVETRVGNMRRDAKVMAAAASPGTAEHKKAILTEVTLTALEAQLAAIS